MPTVPPNDQYRYLLTVHEGWKKLELWKMTSIDREWKLGTHSIDLICFYLISSSLRSLQMLISLSDSSSVTAFLIFLRWFLPLSVLQNFLYILNINPFSALDTINLLSHFIICILSLSMVSFTEILNFDVIKSTLSLHCHCVLKF